MSAASLPDPVRFSVVIEQGDLRSAREWLDSGLSPDFEGATIGSGLMIGAWEGSIPMMELFHSRGADINKTNRLGEQALLHAAWRGKLAAVKWLIDRGARPNRDGSEWSALHYAVFAGHAEVASFLLARGADINALSTNGSTPLMMAAREGHEGIARSLLTAGARRDIVNDHGENALHWAMRQNNLSIAREIGGTERFGVAASRPAASWGPAVRSQPVPDRAESLMAAARRMEAEGRRDEALNLYRAALAAIRQADAARKIAPARARAATGMVITARRDRPEAQSAAIRYATPAYPDTASVGAGDPSAQQGAGATLRAVAGGGAATADVAESWLRRARDLEAAGKRKEALQAYRQAAASLRAASTASGRDPSPGLTPVSGGGPAPPP
ncbi:MAG: ankyrin repeat domain-containing protein [Rhodocyclales bacterium]|nr:ankyrin repeat domain-containing protein [Rhodocyclales bacterium]